MLKIIPAFLFILLMSSPGYCMQSGGEDGSLYVGMNYKKIYDQRDILSQHSEALDQEGLPRVQAPPKSVNEGWCSWTFHKLTCDCLRKKDGFENEEIFELGEKKRKQTPADLLFI